MIFTFLAGIPILITAEKILKIMGVPERLFALIFLVFGAFYLYQIYSYKDIICSKCGNPIFNRSSLFKKLRDNCKYCDEAFL